jgi:hypothetical protein
MNKRSIKIFFGVIFVLALLILGYFSLNYLNNSFVKENNSYGCNTVTGETWCEAKKTCIKSWLEECPLTPLQCQDLGGRIIILLGQSKCSSDEKIIANVSGFANPHVCCMKS